jgi:hypothetical protein
LNIDKLKTILAGWILESYIEGDLSVDPKYYILWSPEELEEINKDYQLQEFVPKFVTLGGNGRGELLVVNVEGEVFCHRYGAGYSNKSSTKPA